tara:strand:- start:2410 stop:2736 length:327 start_codon:yes stop_codon:yes gene_type:complete
MDNEHFRKPVGKDLNGFYITATQLKFFLNRPSGEEQFMTGKDEFTEYFFKCAVYNVVLDMLDKDPNCAYLYWDDNEETVGIKFPLYGSVMSEFKKRKMENIFLREEGH